MIEQLSDEILHKFVQFVSVNYIHLSYYCVAVGMIHRGEMSPAIYEMK